MFPFKSVSLWHGSSRVYLGQLLLNLVAARHPDVSVVTRPSQPLSSASQGLREGSRIHFEKGLQVVNPHKDTEATKILPTSLFSHQIRLPFAWNLPFSNGPSGEIAQTGPCFLPSSTSLCFHQIFTLPAFSSTQHLPQAFLIPWSPAKSKGGLKETPE